ncbi:MAG: RNA-binding cell elongation regulator Jag/EloR [Lachnospiraceae bacterium]|nr:RNA-binding cell elongation regulator Jag/EloR [Lachnospiraceae bacterium]MEE1249207.1 RNA-binding cell elongation regulator Jag/EloR [Lachnospiraceae bacterium]
MEYVEISAKTLDDAITKACIQLGISSDNLEYKVISEGSSGFLGIGSKPAIIKARRMVPTVEEDFFAELKNEEIKKTEPVKKETAAVKPAKVERKPEIKAESKQEKTVVKKEEPEKKSEERVVTPKTEEEIQVMMKTAKEFLDGVFKSMNLEVTMEMKYDQEDGCLDIDFAGPEMGILIGKRGQTLDSLQYLTSLVVNKEQNEYIRVKLDTENYRKRRKDTLENLAKNIAFKVKKTRKPVALEPMNPYERRIIHSALQNHKFVKTVSEGEEPFRHVVVMLKK